VTRDKPAGLDRRAVAPVFRADAAKLPAYVGVDLSPSGYAVYRISKVTAAPPADEAQLRASATALTRQEARETYDAFVDGLRSRAEVTLYPDNLEKRGER
jgi:peptidyl-prolyl cis-trans isomerase D